MSRSQRYRRRRRGRGRHRSQALLAFMVALLIASVAGLSVVGWVVATAASAPALTSLKERDPGSNTEVLAADGTRLGFISIAPPANMYDFTFLAPCPASGIIIQGEGDEVVTPIAVQKLVDKLRTQKHITIHHSTIPGANHFFVNEMPQLMKAVDQYLDFRLDPSCPIR
ncbi:MAG TPA: hypothetical protein VEA61_13035 [Allosphingosinicella sp.]|nr:hypothetical protein [Allosphingosinicella sp.]